jgi:hypothetical protein
VIGGGGGWDGRGPEHVEGRPELKGRVRGSDLYAVGRVAKVGGVGLEGGRGDGGCGRRRERVGDMGLGGTDREGRQERKLKRVGF